MRRGAGLALLLVLWPALAAAERVVAERRWDASTAPPGAVLRIGARAGSNTVRVEGGADRATQLTLWTLDAPGITRPAHALRGELKLRDVSGAGFLEMWTWYGGEEHYFSRTLASDGPLRSLSGSSDWRSFALPFFGVEGRSPTRIEVNLVLPGAGAVELGGLTLVELDGPQDLSSGAADAWWGDRTGGLIGAGLGSGIGLLGAAIGSLSARGRARRLVTSLLAAAAGIGGLALVIGLAALVDGQPYAVYYPLLLCGGIALAVSVFASHTVRRRYQEIELRRMSALDAG